MATIQANYDNLVIALAAENEPDCSRYGGELLEALKAGGSNPTGGELADPEGWSGGKGRRGPGLKNMVRGINHHLGY